MAGYDFMGCAKRLGRVLLGRPLDSSLAVSAAAKGIDDLAVATIGISLRAVYDKVLKEETPAGMVVLVQQLGGHNGQHRTDRRRAAAQGRA